jgi:hypothetical protein
MGTIATNLTTYNKAGTITTDANGIAYVVYRDALPYGFDHIILLTCIDCGIGIGAYVTNKTENGFTINSWVIGGAGAPAPNVTVFWATRSSYNGATI